MSYTYSLACRQCRTRLWVGQGWPTGHPERMIYSTKDHITALGRFLYDHESTTAKAHDLFFASFESGLVDEYAEVEVGEAAPVIWPNITCIYCSTLIPSSSADMLERSGWRYVEKGPNGERGWACPFEFEPHLDEQRASETNMIVDIVTREDSQMTTPDADSTRDVEIQWVGYSYVDIPILVEGYQLRNAMIRRVCIRNPSPLEAFGATRAPRSA